MLAGDVFKLIGAFIKKVVVVGDVGIEVGTLRIDDNFAEHSRLGELMQGVVNGGQRDTHCRRPRLAMEDFRRHVPVRPFKQKLRQP